MPVSAADRALAMRAAEDLLLLPESGGELLELLGQKYGNSPISGEVPL